MNGRRAIQIFCVMEEYNSYDVGGDVLAKIGGLYYFSWKRAERPPCL